MNETFLNEMAHIRKNTMLKINNYGNETGKKLEKLWIKIYGEDKQLVVERYEAIFMHIQNLYIEMLKEETENYETRRADLEKALEIGNQLSTELSLRIELPMVDIDASNIKQQLKDVNKTLEQYKHIKEERLSMLGNYQSEEVLICQKIGEIPTYSSMDSAPSEAKLKEIKAHITSLKSEMSKRTKSYNTLIKDVQDHLVDLEIDSISHEKKMMLEKDSDDVVLTKQLLQKISDWKRDLIEMKEEQIELVEKLKDKVMALWNRLDVGSDDREIVIKNCKKQYGQNTMKLWANELERCEKLKKANIEQVIMKLRGTIATLWDECQMDQTEQDLFTDFNSSDFNEELLESHEQEEQRLRAYYDEIKDLIALAQKWFQLWDKMTEMDSNANSAQRLNNRGGRLLKEEKERKLVSREIPKIELKMQKLVSKYESTYNKPFLYKGAPLMSLINQMYDNKKMEKENEKVRKMVNQNQTRTPYKVNGRLVPPTPTSNSRSKRAYSPCSSSSNKKTPLKPRTLRRSQSCDHFAGYGSNNKVLRSASSNSSAVSYTGFQTYLESTSSIRNSSSPKHEASSKTPHIRTTTKRNTRFQAGGSASKIPCYRV